PWPGNIRELQNLIERAVILSTGPVLRVPLLELRDRPSTTAKPQTMEEAERAHILATLKETKWVIAGPNGAAARLAMNRSTVQFRNKKWGIVNLCKINEKILSSLGAPARTGHCAPLPCCKFSRKGGGLGPNPLPTASLSTHHPRNPGLWGCLPPCLRVT